jgi:tetratricopeptide (TPR) repeat protein
MEITNNIIQNYNYQGYKLYDFFGLLCRMLKERDLGIEVYEYLETQHQNNLPNYTYLYDFYFMKNDIINLVRVLEKIIELRPFVLEDKLNLATYYFQLKRYEDSIEQLKIVLKNDNKSLKAVELLNEIAEQYSDKSKSVELYNFILKNSLYENHEIRLILGKLLINQGSFDEAIKVLQKINSGDPALVCEAKLEIVNALKKMKSYKIALELLESLDSESDSYTGEQKIHILYNKAYCYEKINKLEEAKKLYQRVIMIDINFLDSKERYNKLLN